MHTGLMSEGIYRKSGTFGLVKELQDGLDENKTPKLSKYKDINIITSVLKMYFRDLPVPLISNEFICKFIMQNNLVWKTYKFTF